MTVTPNRLKLVDNTNGHEKMGKLGGSLALDGNTLIDGAIPFTNGEGVTAIVKGKVIYKNGVNDEYELADASTSATAPLQGKYAVAFSASTAAGADGVAVESGRIDAVLVGATPGDSYFLDVNAGDIVAATGPTADDNVLLYVGYAINDTDLFVNFAQPIEQ